MGSEMCIRDRAGRDMSTISINVFGAKPDAEYLETLRAAGVERCLLGLPSADRDKVFSILDRYQPLLDTFKE